MRSSLIVFLLFFIFEVYSSENEILFETQDIFYANRIEHINLTVKEHAGENLNWTIKFKGESLLRSSQRIPSDGKVKIKFKIPALAYDAPLKGRFECSIAVPEKGLSKTETLGKDLLFLQPEPFKNKREALKNRNISILELNTGKKAEKYLSSLEIPYKKFKDAVLETNGTILITGMDFNKASKTASLIFKWALKENHVIILPPIEGEISFPNNGIRSISVYKGAAEPLADKKLLESLLRNSQCPQKNLTLDIGIDKTDIALNNPYSGNSFSLIEIFTGKGRVSILNRDIFQDKEMTPASLYLLKYLILDTPK